MFRFFREAISDFLNKELFVYPKDKKKNYIFISVLRLLRGQFTEDSLQYIRTKQEGKAFPTSSCKCTTRSSTEETEKQVKERLKIIDEHLFVKRTIPISPEVIDIASAIIVQMASTRFYLLIYLFIYLSIIQL